MILHHHSNYRSRVVTTRRSLLLATTALALSALLSHAAAARTDSPISSNNRWEIVLAPVYAYLLQDQRGDAHGGGAQVFIRYGITDSVGIHVSALWTAHAVSDLPNVADSGGTLQVLSGSAGLSYALDLTRFVPRLEADLGVLSRHFNEESTTDMAIKIGLGVDYALNGWLSVGAAFHYHAVLTNLQEMPVYVDMGPRVAFGW